MGSESVVQYPIRAAALLTGLSIDTLRAWERRYQAVTPIRGERGRVYGAGEIRRLILLREAVAHGHAIGQVAGLDDGALEKLLLRPATTTNASVPGRIEHPASDALVPIVAAIESFDYAAANLHLGRLAVLLPVSKLVSEVVLPLMQSVGERWEGGTLSIAQEHMTSSILRNLLGGLVRLGTSSTPSRRILFATPSGELHEFGILAAAMLAVADGFEVLYLGPSLPALEIVAAAERTSPRAVVVGIKASEPTQATFEELRILAVKLPKAVELWLGGSNVKTALSSIGNARTIALEDFSELEEHLARLKGEGQ
ncbi:MAG: MerR family transcriptional regulator [Terracidiphilus sp.]|jgi:methanogenic corrinoid protein MtbC1